jgi:hypothetical protein
MTNVVSVRVARAVRLLGAHVPACWKFVLTEQRMQDGLDVGLIGP